MIHLTKQLLLQYCFILTISITTYSSEQTFVSDYIQQTKQDIDKLYKTLWSNRDCSSRLKKIELSLLALHPRLGIPARSQDIYYAQCYALPDYLDYLINSEKEYVFFEQDALDIIQHIAYFNRRLNGYYYSQDQQYDLEMRARYIKLAHILTKYHFTWNELFDQYRSRIQRFEITDMQDAIPIIYADHDALRAMNLYRPGAVRLPLGKIPHQVPEQSLWNRTKQAWNNVKAEIPKIIDRMPQ